MKAIELSGRIDEERRLCIDQPIPVEGPREVRVLVLIPDDDDLPERTWLHAAARNPAFAFLSDAGEDIYTVADGRPLADEE